MKAIVFGTNVAELRNNISLIFDANTYSIREVMHVSMLSPRVGGGDGQTQENLTFSREPESNSPPLGILKMSNSQP